LFDASKARSMLHWTEADPSSRLEASVNWHLAHPPEDDGDFTEDDNALQTL
jgi:hypothetical protein